MPVQIILARAICRLAIDLDRSTLHNARQGPDVGYLQLEFGLAPRNSVRFPVGISYQPPAKGRMHIDTSLLEKRLCDLNRDATAGSNIDASTGLLHKSSEHGDAFAR